MYEITVKYADLPGASVSWTSANRSSVLNQAKLEENAGAIVTIRNERGRQIYPRVRYGNLKALK